MKVKKFEKTNEKKKGHKRHIITDIPGCLLAVKVNRTNLHDKKSILFVARNAYRDYPIIQKFSGDEGYKGSFNKMLKQS